MIKRYLKRDNPWEILVIGALFFFPGLFMLLQRGPLIGIQQSFRYTSSSVSAISAHGAHLFGGLAMAVGLVLVGLYFHLRRTMGRIVEKRRRDDATRTI